MKVINVSQRSDAWRVWRAQGMSASEAATIMNRSPFKTPWRLYAEKTGLVLEQNLDTNPLVLAGLRQEPVYVGVCPVLLKMSGSNMNWRKIFQVPD